MVINKKIIPSETPQQQKVQKANDKKKIITQNANEIKPNVQQTIKTHILNP